MNTTFSRRATCSPIRSRKLAARLAKTSALVAVVLYPAMSRAQEITPPVVTSKPLLTNSDGSLAIHLHDDDVVLLPSGRLQIDTYGFAGPGVKDYQRVTDGTGLKTNMAFRRFMFELGGVVDKHWFFLFGGNFAPSALDASQRPLSTVLPYNAYVGYEASSAFRILVGQVNVPFTMDNVTSSKSLDFLERSLTSRAIGAPYNMDLGIMALGTINHGFFDYAVGVFGGDGMNRPSVDNRVDAIGRLVLRPLSSKESHEEVEGSPLRNLHVGASFRYGRRDPNLVYYDAPSLTTPGQYAFWTPVFGKGATETHIIPAGDQLALAAEFYVPFHERIDIRGEAVYVKEGRREAFISTLWETERFGTFKGLSYYVQLTFWPLGTPRVNGAPGTLPRVGVAKNEQPISKHGLEIALRFEQILMKYDSNDGSPNACRPGAGDVVTCPSVPAGERTIDMGQLDTRNVGGKTIAARDIKVNVFQLGATYWATRHIRLSAVYSLYQFPGIAPTSINRFGEFPSPPDDTSGKGYNQAAAPGARAGAYNFDAQLFHEFSVRVGLAL